MADAQDTGAPSRSHDATAAVRGSIGLFIAQTIGRAAGAIFVVVAGRTLPPEEFGRYSTAAALVMVFGIVADLGTTSAVTRLVSRGEVGADRLLAALVPVNLVVGCLASVVASGIAAVVYGGPHTVDVMIASSMLPLQSVTTSVLGALDGRGLVATRASLALAATVVQYLGGSVVLVLTSDVRWALVAMPVAGVITLGLAAAIARKTGTWSLRLRHDWPMALRAVRVAVPFVVLAGISVLAARFDVLLLSGLAGADEVAYYDFAVRAIEAVSFLAASVSGPLLFLMNKRLAVNDLAGAQRALDHAIRAVTVLGLGVSALVVSSAPTLVELLLGNDYRDAALPLSILGGQVWLMFIVTVLGAALTAVDNVARVIPVAAAITASTVALDVALVPAFGAKGAAITTAVGSGIAVITFAVVLRRWVGLAVGLPSCRLVAIGVLSTVAGLLAGTADLGPLGLLAPPVVFAAGLAASGELRELEIRSLLGAARPSAPRP